MGRSVLNLTAKHQSQSQRGPCGSTCWIYFASANPLVQEVLLPAARAN